MTEKQLRLFQVREEFLLCLKLLRVYAPPATAQSHRMFKVQHLVIQNVLDGITRYSRMIENPAYDNSIVSRIVMAESVSCMVAAPSHSRTRQQAVEKARIQIIKNSFQVVGMTLCGFNLLASTDLSYQMGFGADLATGNISAVTAGMLSGEGPPIDLGQKNVRQRSQDRMWR